MTYDPTDIHEQQRARDDAERRNRLAQEIEEADFKWLMGSERGRRIVWRLLDRAGTFRLSFDVDAAVTAFNEGRRNEGLRIVAQIHTLCPELYHVMVTEQDNARRDADKRPG